MRSKVASKGLPSPATPLRSESLGSISLRSATGLSELNAQLHLVQSLGSILPHLNRLAEKEQLDAIAAALKMLEGLAPKDAAETMLGVQMISVHHAAVECLRRAHLPEQPAASRDYNLKHAFKFLSLYAQQVEALDRRRGRNPARVTVESVTVGSGGQAVVGVVEGARQAPVSVTAAAPANINDPASALPTHKKPAALPTRAPVRKIRRRDTQPNSRKTSDP